MTRHLPEHKRRDQILAAARSLFVERGYGQTKMSDIASRAGLSKGGVYFHFVSKEEVFGAIVEDEFERSMSFIQDIAKSGDVGSEMLSALAKHFYQRFQGDNEVARFFVVMGEMALRNQQLRQKLVELQKEYHRATADVIGRGIQGGLFREVDPESAAIVYKAIIDGLEANAALDVHHDMKNLRFDALLDVALRGILK